MGQLLRLESVSVGFPKPDGLAFAVRNINFDLPPASISCLVGESGCGKSLTCKAILNLLPAHAVASGNISFDGLNLLDLPDSSLQKIRGNRIGMIFQEPMTSLNPVLTIGEQTAEPLRIHLGMNKRDAKEKVAELFEEVGIPAAKKRLKDYPHQLSGGMRQRVMIAMSLACNPALLLADEPTTALDATVQGQILRLICGQSQERGMGVLLITHDLGVVAEVADKVGVMYAGSLVETAACSELFMNPLHPYTQGLMGCVPGRSSIGLGRLPFIPGHVPPLGKLPCGCPFQPRCAKALPKCSELFPPAIGLEEHKVLCWLYES